MGRLVGCEQIEVLGIFEEDEEVGYKGGTRSVDVAGEAVNVEGVMSGFT